MAKYAAAIRGSPFAYIAPCNLALLGLVAPFWPPPASIVAQSGGGQLGDDPLILRLCCPHHKGVFLEIAPSCSSTRIMRRRSLRVGQRCSH